MTKQIIKIVSILMIFFWILLNIVPEDSIWKSGAGINLISNGNIFYQKTDDLNIQIVGIVRSEDKDRQMGKCSLFINGQFCTSTQSDGQFAISIPKLDIYENKQIILSIFDETMEHMDTTRQILLDGQSNSYSLEIVMNVAQSLILESPQQAGNIEISGLNIELEENTFDNKLGKVIIHSSFIDSDSPDSLNTAPSMIDQDRNALQSDNMFSIHFKDSENKNIELNQSIIIRSPVRIQDPQSNFYELDKKRGVWINKGKASSVGSYQTIGGQTFYSTRIQRSGSFNIDQTIPSQSINGIVNDQGGRPIPYASVKVIGVGYNGWYHTTTNNQGQFTATVKKGSYFTVEAFKRDESFKVRTIYDTTISTIDVLAQRDSQVNEQDIKKFERKKNEIIEAEKQQNDNLIQYQLKQIEAKQQYYNKQALKTLEERNNQDMKNQQQDQVQLEGTPQLDSHGNFQGQEYDLGTDGAFNSFSILAGLFDQDVFNTWEKYAGSALNQKGFKVFKTYDQEEFIKQIKSSHYSLAIIVSDQTFKKPHKQLEFTEAVLQFHQSKKGLILFGDNYPFFYHANLVLQQIAGTKLTGNNHGDQLLKSGSDSSLKGYFDKSSIVFAGINSLYEGNTISYPDSNNGQLITLATGTDGKPCICKMDRTQDGGRVIVDTGYTKLFHNYQKSAGINRYIVNICVFVADIQRNIGEIDL